MDLRLKELVSVRVCGRCDFRGAIRSNHSDGNSFLRECLDFIYPKQAYEPAAVPEKCVPSLDRDHENECGG